MDVTISGKSHSSITKDHRQVNLLDPKKDERDKRDRYYKGPLSKDSLNISRSAIRLLEKEKSVVKEVMDQYPEYKGLLTNPEEGQSSTPSLSQIKQFVQNPQQADRASKDSRFGDFFSELQQIAVYNHQALVEIQQESHFSKQPTLYSPYR